MTPAPGETAGPRLLANVEAADPARSGAWSIDVTAARSGGQDDRPAALNPHGSVAETLRRGEQLYRKLGERLPNVAVLVFDHRVARASGLPRRGGLSALPAADRRGVRRVDLRTPRRRRNARGVTLEAPQAQRVGDDRDAGED